MTDLLLLLWLFSAFCCLYCCFYDFSLHQVFEDSPDLDHSALNEVRFQCTLTECSWFHKCWLLMCFNGSWEKNVFQRFMVLNPSHIYVVAPLSEWSILIQQPFCNNRHSCWEESAVGGRWTGDIPAVLSTPSTLTDWLPLSLICASTVNMFVTSPLQMSSKLVRLYVHICSSLLCTHVKVLLSQHSLIYPLLHVCQIQPLITSVTKIYLKHC